ncbi:MAG: hypothetical protein V3W50_04440, partial [Thermoanaerobaculia bacterium]
GCRQGARRSRCGVIVDDEQRRMQPQPPCARRVTGGVGPPAALLLLPDDTASQSSQRLAFDPTAPVTQLRGLLGRAPGGKVNLPAS